MGKGTQKEKAEPEMLFKVQRDAENGAKPDYAPDTICKTLSSHKAKTAVACLMSTMTILILILTVALAVETSHVPEPLLSEPCCPDGWVGYQGKCYYFSEAEGNWKSSQHHCSLLGASLAGVDTLQDLAFLMRYKGRSYHWIGLWREESQPWKWTNGTEFNSMFEVRGGGSCAYLNDVAVISSRCLTEKNWVCSKPSLHLKKD
ncbi:C-type lectin domain family 2 member D-like isoform X1 [Dermochelys coriacea]|uniref:C-type lectin domain family 2 member D-like isoform X1 n=1 Tax=Dermochelys coriacea TaxID=27794 RepID=UPI0018E7C0CC|nr:C-type lectin domain family 2 member D-like isoform X1 [Dermochelys coriacea]XP_043353068.1 C-type lectin domain family 2 member D-like isoform X1 [Dermochelys coriacea]